MNKEKKMSLLEVDLKMAQGLYRAGIISVADMKALNDFMELEETSEGFLDCNKERSDL